MKICTVSGCNDPVRSKGYCQLHYSRWVTNGKVSPDPNIPKRGIAKGKFCEVPGCNNKVRCVGLCSHHYSISIDRNECPICGAKKRKDSKVCYNCNYQRTLVIPSTKICTGCKVEKPVVDFGFRSDGRGATKIRSLCRFCSTEKSREHRKKIPIDVIKTRKIKESEKNKCLRIIDNDSWLRKSIRISARMLKLNPVEVLNHFDIVGNKCECCGVIPSIDQVRIAVDHDHKTGKFRGFLCGSCNLFLGHIEKNYGKIPLLQKYLINGGNSGIPM